MDRCESADDESGVFCVWRSAEGHAETDGEAEGDGIDVSERVLADEGVGEFGSGIFDGVGCLVGIEGDW